MGLPVWRAQSPDPRDAPRPDLSAAARSPIRRRSPFAGRRARAARTSTSSASPISPRFYDNAEYLLSAARVAQTASPSRRRRSNVPALDEEPPVPASRTTSALREGNTRFSISDTNNPTAFFGEAALASDDWASYRDHYQYDREQRLRERPHRTQYLPALTPNFAPAAGGTTSRTSRLERRAEYGPYSTRHRSPNARVLSRSRSPWFGDRDINILVIDGEPVNVDNNVTGFPPLRRMGRRHIVDGPLPDALGEFRSPSTTVDGLGDRERSISPIDEWDTMHATVAPDPLAPSADSSFTSAAASASFSNSHPSSRAGSANSNSVASSRTHLTVPSRQYTPPPPHELLIRVCDTSEDESGSDTEADDIEVRPHPSYRRRNRRMTADGPPARDHRAVSREASAYVRSVYRSQSSFQSPDDPSNDQLDGAAEFNALDQELQGARVVLQRLAQREDIPDHFWASMGLARQFADRVIQQRD